MFRFCSGWVWDASEMHLRWSWVLIAPTAYVTILSPSEMASRKFKQLQLLRCHPGWSFVINEIKNKKHHSAPKKHTDARVSYLCGDSTIMRAAHWPAIIHYLAGYNSSSSRWDARWDETSDVCWDATQMHPRWISDEHRLVDWLRNDWNLRWNPTSAENRNAP